LALAALEKVPMVSAVDLDATMRDLQALRDQIEEALGAHGVLVCPTFPRPAPRHGWAMLTPFDAGYTAVFNALGLPVTAVPTGLSSAGLPTGVQVASRHGADHMTIAVAMALEQDLGGWVPPWTVGKLL
jgi:fatty acid amide hydrolase 2